VAGYLFQPGIEALELAVDEDAQGLEDLGRRVHQPAPRMPVGKIFHEQAQLDRRVPGGEKPFFDDRLGQAPGIGHFAVAAENVGQLFLGERVEHVGGGGAGGLVLAHVQRPVEAVGKTAAVLLQLRGGDARVHQHAGNVQAPEVEILEEADERALVEAHALAEAPQVFPGQGQAGPVQVERDHPALREGGEDMVAVAAPAHRAVHKKFFSGAGKYFQHLFIHDGVMQKIH
jgi:hypothetical protein